jgi:hypothetical protein
MTQVNQLRVVVASPSDVKAERKSVETVAEELQHTTAKFLGLDLVVTRWETDSYPGFHAEGPQGLLDPILKIADADIVVGIFWKRLGTPTKSGQTGTEHEINTAIEAWKKKQSPHIMLYFSQRPYALQSKEEAEQWGAVLEFKKKLEEAGEGLFSDYNDPSHFEKILRQHLTIYVNQRYAQKPTTPAIQAPSRFEWHPPSDLRNRGELAPCWFSLNPNFKKDGENRWNKWGDLLVNLENAHTSDNVYLLPTRKAPERLREWTELKKSHNLAEKQKIGEAFARQRAGKRLEGMWFFKHIKAEDRDRVHVYSTDYDNFLNDAVAESKSEKQA